MRIHGNKITPAQVWAAGRWAGVTVVQVTEHGSRKRSGALEVRLEGSSPHRTQDHQGYAATWDEWGMFLDYLFRADDTLTVPRVYEDREDFRWQTGARFDDLRPDDQHKRHRFEYAGTSATGAYSAHECPCGAVMRRLTNGSSWSEFNESRAA